MSKYLDLSVLEIHRLYQEKKLTPKELLEEVFERIEKRKSLNCFITLNKEEAMKEA